MSETNSGRQGVERDAFQREDRYIVIKRSDVASFWRDDVRDQFMAALARLNEHNVRVPQRQYVVVESDWPEYETVWRMIEARVTGGAITTKSCTWKHDWETGAYSLGCCSKLWHFTDGGPVENGAKFCHHCAGEIVVEQRSLFAYQVGDNDIVAAYDPAGAIQVLCEFNGCGNDFDENDVELVSDKMLDNTEAFDVDEGKAFTLEKTLRQELAELAEPAYLHGWE